MAQRQGQQHSSGAGDRSVGSQGHNSWFEAEGRVRTGQQPLLAIVVMMIAVCAAILAFAHSTRVQSRCTRNPVAWWRRTFLLLLLLFSCCVAASPTQHNNEPAVAQLPAGLINFQDPATQASAVAELQELRSQPFNADALASQFAHGIDEHLPHGQRHAPASSEYWTDPETKLVHHRLPHLSDAQFQQLVAVTRQYAATTTAYTLEQVTGYTGEAPPMSIDLGDVKRVFAPPRRNYSPAELDIMQSKVEELIRAGHVVHLESSNFACNVVLAAKRAPDGTWSDKRFCVNFIPVNKHTVLDNYGSHKAETLLHTVARKAYLTALDMRSGFHQILMLPEDVCKTAFWYVRKNLPPVLMAYNCMPFGLKNASAKFQRVMDFELQKHGLTEFAYAYIDDLIIASDTWEEHVEHVRRVMEMLQSCGLKIHPSKSIFGSDVLEYLGHNVVGKHGITMNEAKVASLKALPTPSNLTELRSVLGFMSYYRHFIPGFSSIAEPLIQLMRKNVPFVWGPEQVQAFDVLRKVMSQPGLVLRPVDPNKELILHTDWSVRGIGAVLGQVNDEGKEYLCACVSRSLNKHERNYPSYKGELLALTWAVKMFRQHLHGVHFKLVTDHRPLLWLMETRDLSGQYARWQMLLQEHSFTVMHRAGLKHQNADALSRFPDPQTEDHETGTQLDPEVVAVLRRPGLCLAIRAGDAGSAAGSPAHADVPGVLPQDGDFIDAFCPSFTSLIGPGSVFPDPVYYSYQVMHQSSDCSHADQEEESPEKPILQGKSNRKTKHKSQQAPKPDEGTELGDQAQQHQAMCEVARACIMKSMVHVKDQLRSAVQAAAKELEGPKGIDLALNEHDYW